MLAKRLVIQQAFLSHNCLILFQTHSHFTDEEPSASEHLKLMKLILAEFGRTAAICLCIGRIIPDRTIGIWMFSRRF